jgi:hypothetical protein
MAALQSGVRSTRIAPRRIFCHCHDSVLAAGRRSSPHGRRAAPRDAQRQSSHDDPHRRNGANAPPKQMMVLTVRIPLPPPTLPMRTVSPFADRPGKAEEILPFLAGDCAPWARAVDSKSLSDDRLSLWLFTSPIRYPVHFRHENQCVSRPLISAEFAIPLGWPRYKLETHKRRLSTSLPPELSTRAFRPAHRAAPRPSSGRQYRNPR